MAAVVVLALGVEPLSVASTSHFVRMHQWHLGAEAAGATRSFSDLEDIAALEYQEAEKAWQHQKLLPAIQLFKRSAQKGHEVGEYCFRWGQYHELAPSDFKQAIRWYQRGAKLLHKASMTSLGKIYFASGHHARAQQWLSLTAKPHGPGGETGDSLAQWFLAEIHMQGGAMRLAVRWWKRSAENGDIDAMMRLSHVFSEGGAGIPQELMRSRHWLFAAAANGHQNALSNVTWNKQDRPVVERRWIESMERYGWV